MVGQAIAALIGAFLIGAVARFALPGPDPMPAWLTIVIGLGGSTIGYGLVYGIGGRKTALSWGALASVGAAVGLVIIYRRFVQKRPVWGRGVYRFPERGFGVEQYRERLKRVGIDPDKIGTGEQTFGTFPPREPVNGPFAAAPGDHPGDPTENPAHYLRLLEELHDTGVLDDDEYNESRTRLLESLRAQDPPG
jgi:uncharacterized membrane protein YeaQ/YmgE (transglycosylase-associated protein family)